MNEARSFERFVADSVAGTSQGIPLPDDFYDDIYSFATTTGQRPKWLALIKEPPMRTNSRVAAGSPTVRVMAILAATFLLIVTMAAMGIGVQRLLASDGRIVVDQSGNGDYTTIGDALAAAVDGDEILVRAGTYAEQLDVTKSVSLIGEGDRGGVTVEYLGPSEGGAEADAYVLRLAGRDGAIRNIDLRGPELGTAIIVDGGAPTLERMTVQPGSQTSLRLDSGDAVFRDVDLHGRSSIRRSSPVFEDSRLWCGATIATDAVFLRSSFLDEPSCPRAFAVDEYGIQVDFASPSIIDSAIEMPGDVLEIYGTASEPIIEGNTFTAADTAIGTFQGARPRIRDNVFADNQVAMALSGAAVVEGNSIASGGSGVLVREGKPTLTGNTIEGVSGLALSVEGTSAPTLRDNSLCGFGESVFVADTAAPDIDDSNEICDGSGR